jgi:hypothetical protein
MATTEKQASKVDDLRVWWNPLDDDGDALGLAVKLKLSTEFYSHGVEVSGFGVEDAQPYEADSFKATRLAIVRAAAQLGAPR